MENDVPEEVTISVKIVDGSVRSFQLTDAQRKAVIRALGLSVIRDELAGLDDWTIELMLAE